MPETNHEFANRMRIRRGEKPRQPPRVPVVDSANINDVQNAIAERFADLNPEMVTVGNIEAAVRQLPGVADVKVDAKTSDRLDLHLKLDQTIEFIPITVSLKL